MPRPASQVKHKPLASAATPGRETVRTQKQLAELAGVSYVTIFNALHQPHKVKQATRERIFQLMAEHDYHPDGVARAMVNGKTNVIGLIVPELEVAYYAKFVSDVERAANMAGYHCLICQHHDIPFKEAQEIQMLREHRVDGIILRNCGTATDTDSVRRLARAGVPFVLWDGLTEGFAERYVGGDDRRDAAAAVTSLLQAGCRRVAFVGFHRNGNFRHSDRYDGYVEALQAAGLTPDPELAETCQTEYTSGRLEVLNILRRNGSCPPDGIFASNDHTALGVLAGLQEAGVRVPQDVAVMGFGGYLDQALLPLTLSTVVQDVEGMALRATCLLLAEIDGKPTEKGPHRIKGTVKVGQSAQRPVTPKPAERY